MSTDKSSEPPVWFKVIVGFLLVLGLIWILPDGDDDEPVSPAVAAERAAERAASAAANNTARACVAAVRQRLADPAGGDFPLFTMASQVQHVGTERHILASYVDTTNAFGAAVRINYRCVVNGSGSDLVGYRVTSLEIG